MISLQDNSTSIEHESQQKSSYFASLANNLIHRAEGEPIQVSVTSSQSGEGVSTIAAHLAVACAKSGVATLLIDANFDSPSQKSRFDVVRTIGLADILNGAASPECIQTTGVEGLDLITAGTATRREDSQVSPAALTQMLSGLAEKYPVIIVDSPFADRGAAICAQTDGSILVVEAEGVRREVVAKSRAVLETAGANILGVVLNKRKRHVPNWLYRRL